MNLKKLLLTREQPFIFSSQVSQVFFLDYVQDLGWKILLLKVARSQREVGSNVDHVEPMGPITYTMENN
jgi:hypothetical protein